jgi:large subunit ribosomal protein L9
MATTTPSTLAVDFSVVSLGFNLQCHKSTTNMVWIVLFVVLLLHSELFSVSSYRFSVFHPKISTVSSIFSTKTRLQAAPAKSTTGDKIRVKLVTDVKGTGRKGDIILVSAAQYTNVLSPKKLAERVSDDTMNQLNEKKKEIEQAELANAQTLADKLENWDRVTIARKVGANNHLFGAVTNKQLLELVKEKFGEHFTPSAQFSVSAVKGAEGTEDPGEDLRQTGVYVATLKLHAKVTGQFSFEVVAETKSS